MEKLFQYNVKAYNDRCDFYVYGVSSMLNPKDNTIMFLTLKNLDEACGIEKCHNCLIFVPESYDKYSNLNGHCIVKSKNPRRDYAELINRLVSSEDSMEYEQKDGSWISKDVMIGKNVLIGPGCYIGNNVKIGDNCIIYPGVKIHGPVQIGNNVVIRDNALIGVLGFGFVDDENGSKIRFPFLGRVRIENNVEIGAMSNIERSIIDETVLEQGVKLDVGTIIGHDSAVGKDTMVVCAKVAGHVQIGEQCFIGLGANIKPRVKIGNQCKVGVGAVVIRDVVSGDTVAGVPAKTIKK